MQRISPPTFEDRIFAPARRTCAALAAVVVLALSPSAARADEAIDPDAVSVLKQMSDFLGAQGSMSASYEASTEVVLTDGQKISYVGAGAFEFQRPGKLYVSRQGLAANAELFFNGAQLVINGKTRNVYYSKELSGSVDDAIDVVRSEIGLDAPAADFFHGDVAAYLGANAVSARHIGETMMSGMRVHHLAFRTPDVDWQIWVRADGDPVPLVYTITSKWVAQAPAYTVRFSDWKFGAPSDAARFDFTPPEGATKVEQLDVDAIGEIAQPEESK